MEVNFDLTNAGKAELNSSMSKNGGGSFEEQTGASHSFTQGITVDNTVPGFQYQALVVMRLANIPETQAGVKISGSTNAEVGSRK